MLVPRVPTVPRLCLRPPIQPGSNPKTPRISYEGGHDIASWLQFLGEHTELKLQDVLDQTLGHALLQGCLGPGASGSNRGVQAALKGVRDGAFGLRAAFFLKVGPKP